MAKRTFFYATSKDLKPLIHTIESTISIKYLKAGLLDNADIVEYDSILKYHELGRATNTSNLFCDRFLVAHKDTQIIIEEVPQSKGGLKYEVSEVLNPDTVIFWPAGEFSQKNAVIEGIITTNSNTTKSIELYNSFVKTMKKQFIKYKSYYLGVDANEFFRKGWRLAENLERPEAYDLK